MTETKKIKKYSSIYATKLNYIMDKLNQSPLNMGRHLAIENITGEPTTTIRNWLFNSKLPRESKKLKLADKLGVSYEYLFNDNIDIRDIRKPEIYLENGIYYSPVFNEKDIFNVKDSMVFSVESRTPLVIPNVEGFIKKYGTQIYACTITKSNLKPQIMDNAMVVYSENMVEFDEWKILLCVNEKNTLPCFKKIILDDDGVIKLLSYDNKNNEIIEPIKTRSDYLMFHASYNYENI